MKEPTELITKLISNKNNTFNKNIEEIVNQLKEKSINGLKLLNICRDMHNSYMNMNHSSWYNPQKKEFIRLTKLSEIIDSAEKEGNLLLVLGKLEYADLEKKCTNGSYPLANDLYDKCYKELSTTDNSFLFNLVNYILKICRLIEKYNRKFP